MTGGISIHCVDVASGRVASGLAVTVWRLDNMGRRLEPPLAAGVIGSDGLLQHPALMSAAVATGGYEVEFGVGGYCRALNPSLPEPLFLEVVPYRFHIHDAEQHWHLPFKFTPWGFSLFRGGA